MVPLINVYLPPDTQIGHQMDVDVFWGRKLWDTATLGTVIASRGRWHTRWKEPARGMSWFKPMSQAISQGVVEQLEISHACSALVCSRTASLISLI